MEITHKIMAVSQERSVTELWFLCTAPLNNVCNQCIKFQVDRFFSLEDVAQKKIQNEIIKRQFLKN